MSAINYFRGQCDATALSKPIRPILLSAIAGLLHAVIRLRRSVVNYWAPYCVHGRYVSAEIRIDD